MKLFTIYVYEVMLKSLLNLKITNYDDDVGRWLRMQKMDWCYEWNP